MLVLQDNSCSIKVILPYCSTGIILGQEDITSSVITSSDCYTLKTVELKLLLNLKGLSQRGDVEIYIYDDVAYE